MPQVVEQGFAEIRQEFLGELKRAGGGQLEAERDGRLEELGQEGQEA